VYPWVDAVDKKDPAIIAFESALGFGNQTVLDTFRNKFK
jgi:hypothetical protein